MPFNSRPTYTPFPKLTVSRVPRTQCACRRCDPMTTVGCVCRGIQTACRFCDLMREPKNGHHELRSKASRLNLVVSTQFRVHVANSLERWTLCRMPCPSFGKTNKMCLLNAFALTISAQFRCVRRAFKSTRNHLMLGCIDLIDLPNSWLTLNSTEGNVSSSRHAHEHDLQKCSNVFTFSFSFLSRRVAIRRTRFWLATVWREGRRSSILIAFFLSCSSFSR